MNDIYNYSNKSIVITEGHYGENNGYKVELNVEHNLNDNDNILLMKIDDKNLKRELYKK